MSFVSRLRPKALSSRELQEFTLGVSGGSTSSGISVTSDNATKSAIVFACVNILSRAFSQLPCHLMQQNGKDKEKATEHPLYFLLHDQPNEWMTAPEFWGMALVHLLLRGNFFALKNTHKGRVNELIPLAPNVVQEVKQTDFYKLIYKCRFPDGSIKEVQGSDILHLRGLSTNGYMGMNPIEQVRESIGFSLAAQEFGASYFGNGIHPGVIVEHPSTLKDPKTFTDIFMETYSGLGKAHRVMLLQEGMKAQKISINPQDAQFLETRRYQKKEIVDIFFSLPLSMLMTDDTNPTFASAEQFGLSFVIYSLMPWAVNIEKALARDLLTPDERKTHYVKFKMDGLLRGDMATRFAAYATAIDKEIMNPNEVRELEDLNPYPGGERYATRTSSIKQDNPSPDKDGATP